MQSLLRGLVARADARGRVRLDAVRDRGVVERIYRYRRVYGDGGFQRRLGAVED
jgi:hypothetical protein